jgi:colanic acid/amylovoran biosynthesis glycosyltransferase
MTLRIGYLTGQYPRATDTFIQREVAMLRTLGHHVQTFAVRKPSETENVSPEITLARKSTIYLLPPHALARAHLGQFVSSPKRYSSALVLAWKYCPPGLRGAARQIAYFAEAGMLARLMKKHSLTHLHNHFADSSCSVTTIASVMGGFSYSFTMHGPGEFFAPKQWWVGEKIRRALFVNCISYFCRSQAMVFAPPSCWKKVRVVHCGIDPNLFDPKMHRGPGRQLLFVGRLTAEKGLPILLESISELEGAILEIAGDGPDKEMLLAEAQKLGVSNRVRFLGYQSQQQVRALLKQADVFVMSSFAEGLPVVLMEAMAAGVPVVATRIAGIPELVSDEESGLIVLPGDANAITKAVGRLLEDPDLRNRLAAAGRAKVEREFNINVESRWLAKILSCSLIGAEAEIETLRPVELR